MTVSFLVPWPDGAQLEFVYSMGGIVFENRLWMLNRQPPTTQTQLDDLALAASTYWIANQLPLQSHEARLELVRATSWDNPLAPLTGFVVTGLDGGVTGPSHSANVAIRVSFGGPDSIRIFRNGNFFGGVPQDAVDVNVIDALYADALFEAYVGMIDASAAWGSFPAWRWSVASLELDHVLRSEIFARRVVTAEIRMPYVTQRRMRLR